MSSLCFTYTVHYHKYLKTFFRFAVHLHVYQHSWKLEKLEIARKHSPRYERHVSAQFLVFFSISPHVLYSCISARKVFYISQMSLYNIDALLFAFWEKYFQGIRCYESRKIQCSQCHNIYTAGKAVIAKAIATHVQFIIVWLGINSQMSLMAGCPYRDESARRELTAHRLCFFRNICLTWLRTKLRRLDGKTLMIQTNIWKCKYVVWFSSKHEEFRFYSNIKQPLT